MYSVTVHILLQHRLKLIKLSHIKLIYISCLEIKMSAKISEVTNTPLVAYN